MVARISFSKRLLAALNYNENKCSKGNAVCIAAVNFLREANEMNFHQKHLMLEMRNELNSRATTKTIHISLNFDPSEKLEEEKLKAIANEYMKKIGFEEQPYLVYQHFDAAHPHVHIVSTTIREDGTRINTHNIGRTLSEKARKEIEAQFGLVKAERQKRNVSTIKAINAEKIIYGKSELKRSISNVASYVFNNYKFSSLPEFNAALNQFNVMLDRGNEGGRIYKNRGIIFRVLDEKGNKVGIPVKASLISCKPTLDNLEKKFINKDLKEPFKEKVKNVIDDAMRSSVDLNALIEKLKKKNIVTVLRQNEERRIYGITFVDNEQKIVFNGSDLGKEYSAPGLMKKFEVPKNTKNHKEHNEENQRRVLSESLVSSVTKKETENIIIQITSAEANYQNVPFQLKKRKKKKRKHGHKEH